MVLPSTLVERAQDLLKALYKGLYKHFEAQGRVLVSVEVWANVFYLRFASGPNRFFSKKEAAKLANLNYYTLTKNLGPGLRHLNLDAKKKAANNVATKALKPVSPEDAAMVKQMLARAHGISLEEVDAALARTN